MPGPDSDPLPSAVLWDMDGTLVDTEPYWIEAEYALVGEHGGHWGDAQAHSLVGNPLLVSAEVVRDEGGVRPRARRHRRPADVARGRAGALGAAVAPGVLRLLDELAGLGVPQAMVTMSWMPLVDALLAHLPDGLFAAVVTGDEVEHGKPHPEPYLTAMARMSLLGVEPSGRWRSRTRRPGWPRPRRPASPPSPSPTWCRWVPRPGDASWPRSTASARPTYPADALIRAAAARPGPAADGCRGDHAP